MEDQSAEKEISVGGILGPSTTLSRLMAHRLKALIARHNLSDEATEEIATLLQEARRLAVLPEAAEPPPDDTLDLLRSVGDSGEPSYIADSPSLLSLPTTPRFGHEDRYRCLDHIGSGGMGDVFRVWDRDLGRIMAMKILRKQRTATEATVLRFLEEARVTARLEHPGIIPVHDIGQLDDGRYYFTMKEVRGRSLSSVIRSVHNARTESHWPPTEDGWTLRRLIDVFHRVCVTVAYAHDRGVIHRDIKPSNIMVGEYGEVLVLDWGLARALGQSHDPSAAEDPVPFRPATTREGRIIGTAAYMPPEQARGKLSELGPAADVYALGATLYHILTGAAPYSGITVNEILERVLAGAPPPPGRIVRSPSPQSPPPAAPARPVQSPAPVPEALRILCLWAMARNPDRRPTDASVLADEVLPWLEGEERRRLALDAVADADRLLPLIKRYLSDAEIIEASAKVFLSRLPAAASVSRKQQGWQAEDEARALRQKADLTEVRYLQALRGALNHDPNLPDAHERLAAFYRERHERAESSGDERLATWIEMLLREHDRTGRHQTYLEGHGTLTIHTNPPGVTVTAYRYAERERRLHTEKVSLLGKTPLDKVVLPRGSYLLELSGQGLETVRYPLLIDRSSHWTGVAPGARSPMPIPLPPQGELEPGEVYIPPGWFWSGGDSEAPGSLPRRRVWVDGFIMQRLPVTNQAYLSFLNDLLREGRKDEAMAYAPRERAARPGDSGDLLYQMDSDGRFVLGRDAEGDAWSPDEAVVMVDWPSAMAYARTLSERTGLEWRLPGELEWEKAARGADGRAYPWGNFFDATWACTQAAYEGRPSLPAVDSFPIDESPYGVRGLAGNVCDWCLDTYTPDGPEIDTVGRVMAPIHSAQEGPRVFRGGSWLHTPRYTRSAVRTRYESTGRGGGLGFRLVRSYPNT